MINMFNEDSLNIPDVSTYKDKIKDVVGDVEPELDSFIETLALHYYLQTSNTNKVSISKLLKNKSIV